MENWLPVVGYEGFYEVSDLGNIKALKREWLSGRNNCIRKTKPEHLLRIASDREGYKIGSFCKDGNTKMFKAHRIVAIAFLGLVEGKNQINHKNGIKSDNRLENLEWCDVSENQIHAYRTGLSVARFGDKSPMHKLSEENVLKIRELIADGILLKDIAKMYSLHKNHVSAIKRKLFWAHI